MWCTGSDGHTGDRKRETKRKVQGIMKGRTKVLGGLVLAALMLTVSACTKEKLDSRKLKGYFEIELSNEDGFGNQTTSHDENTDACSRIYIYSADSKALVLAKDCEYLDAEMKHVFRGTLEVGKYHVVTMNSRHTNAELKYPENYETARIEVVNAGLAEAVTKGNADPTLIGEPATVFLTHRHKIKGEESLETVFEVKDRETLQAEVAPQSMVKRIMFTIRLEQPLSADDCTAIFSGISRMVKCSTCESMSNAEAHARAQLEIEKDPAAPRNIFRAALNLFGLMPTTGKPHDLQLALKNGDEMLETTVNISDDIERKLEEMEGDFSFEIPLDLEIKVTRSIDGELHASVERWGDGGSGSGTGGV